MWSCCLFVCLGSFFVYKDSFIIHTPMEMPRNLSRGKHIFARDNNKLSSQGHRSAMVTKNHAFCTKKNIQVKWLLSEEKTFPSVENVLRLQALGRTKNLEQGVFCRGEGASVRTSQSAKTQKDTTRRENLTWQHSPASYAGYSNPWSILLY